MKIVSSLLTGVVAIVGSCSAALCAAGVPVHGSLRSFRADEGVSFQQELRSSGGDNGQNSFSWLFPSLHGYGYGHDAMEWKWTTSKQKSISLCLYLSAVGIRYCYSSLIVYQQRLHTIFTKGICPIEGQEEKDSKFVWAPYRAVDRLFSDVRTEARFIKSWRDEIDDEYNLDTLKSAWERNLGVSYDLTVGVDGSVIGKGDLFVDTEHEKGKVSEGGVDGVVGDNAFPDNRLKIFLNDECARVITDNLDTPEKLWKWLFSSTSSVIYGFPASSDLKSAIMREGNWLAGGRAVPVWGDGYDKHWALKSVVNSKFSLIRKVAKETQSSSGKKGTGMEICLRLVTSVAYFSSISKQEEPTIHESYDKYKRFGDSVMDNRQYICWFGWKSCAEFYQIANSNHFYNALTNYEGSTVHAWSLGTKFRRSELSSDLDDIQDIINQAEPSEYMGTNDYKTYAHFRKFLRQSILHHRCLYLEFWIFHDTFFHNRFAIDVGYLPLQVRRTVNLKQAAV